MHVSTSFSTKILVYIPSGSYGKHVKFRTADCISKGLSFKKYLAHLKVFIYLLSYSALYAALCFLKVIFSLSDFPIELIEEHCVTELESRILQCYLQSKNYIFYR